MPAGYEKIRDKFISEGMNEKEAKTRAAKIWNAQNPENPVTRAKDSIHPRFCEIVLRGAREGTYLGRNGPVQYSVLWKDNKDPQWVPSACIERTGRINHTILQSIAEAAMGDLEKNISSRVKTRRRGGLRKGPRYAVGSPGGSVRQGRAGQPGDPRNLHKPVEDEEDKNE